MYEMRVLLMAAQPSPRPSPSRLPSPHPLPPYSLTYLAPRLMISVPPRLVSLLRLLPGVRPAVSEGCVGWALLCGGRQGDAGQGGGQLDVGADCYAGNREHAGVLA